jgi:hypothetical protein
MASSEAPTIPTNFAKTNSRPRAKRSPARQGEEDPSRLIAETRSTPHSGPSLRLSPVGGRNADIAKTNSPHLYVSYRLRVPRVAEGSGSLRVRMFSEFFQGTP